MIILDLLLYNKKRMSEFFCRIQNTMTQRRSAVTNRKAKSYKARARAQIRSLYGVVPLRLTCFRSRDESVSPPIITGQVTCIRNPAGVTDRNKSPYSQNKKNLFSVRSRVLTYFFFKLLNIITTKLD